MMYVGSLLMFSGVFFILAGTVGLLRFPDVLSRMHATTKCDTLGAGLVLFGLMLFPGTFYFKVKLLLVIVFLWITNTTGAHYMARAIYRTTKGRE